MVVMESGARVEIDARLDSCVVEAGGGSPRLAAACIVGDGGQARVTVARGEGPWTLPLPTSPDERARIVLYMDNETERGRVEDRGPLRVRVGGEAIELAARSDRHGAVLLAEIYTHKGRRLARAGGEGYAFGIKALARKGGIPIEPFLAEPARGTAPDMRRPQPAPGRSQGVPVSSGSGVLVARDHLVTNAHVVDGAARLVVHGIDADADARVIAVDERHDLALVRAVGVGGDPAPIRGAGTLRLGEPVTAAGYPLRDVLGADLKISGGHVSGMKGPGGDVAAFQFTAPIGSGSSGGAVLDARGCLAGVVAAALAHDSMRMHGRTHSENVNFAIASALVLQMLAAHDIDATEPNGPAMDPVEVVRRARRAVFAITVMQ